MLTIFAVPKAFRGQFAIIQENAIASWTKIRPKPEIILFGDDVGVAKVAKKYKLKHISVVKKNAKGTPILSDIFQKAKEASKNKILCFVNADIILPPYFYQTISKVRFKKFMVSGRRWNFKIGKKLGFEKGWFEKIKNKVEKRGLLYQPGALDYFVFLKNFDFKMPSFAIGRGVWDNWVIYRAKYLKIPVIDATGAVFAIHQKHDYSHAGGHRAVWHGKERKGNLNLAREKKKPFNLVNADYLLTANGVKRPKFSIYRYWRVLQIDPTINPQRALVTQPLVFTIEMGIKVCRKLKNLLGK